MESDASWSMTWDDHAQTTGSFEEMSLRLPQGQTLMAKVMGQPSFTSAKPRTTFLCAGSSGALVIRSESGLPMWSNVHPGQFGHGGLDRANPDDVGGECMAVVDGQHLVEWLNSTRYDLDGEQLTGAAEAYGPFSARLDSDHRFVKHVDVQPGTPHARRVIEVQSWRVVDDEPELLRPVLLDLRERLA